MPGLSTTHRQYLRRLAHDLTPVVHIGKQGLTAEVLNNVDQVLGKQELIKIKLTAGQDEKDALAEELVSATGSSLVGLIGNIVIVYRQQPDVDKRKITLPR